VYRKIGRDPADQPADPRVLDDGGIDPGRDDRAQRAGRLGQLLREDQRVERDVALDAAAVKVGHQLREIGLLEILGTDPGVEAPHPEEDRVGAVLDGGLHAIPLPGGRQDLGFAESAATGNDGHASIKGPRAGEGSGKFAGSPKPRARFLCCPATRRSFG